MLMHPCFASKTVPAAAEVPVHLFCLRIGMHQYAFSHSLLQHASGAH